jgi:hypothetical protein
VVAGRDAAAVLIFKKATRGGGATSEGPRSFSLNEVEKAGGWTKENNILMRTGGNYVILPVGGAPGTYAFTAMMQKGKRLDWVLAFNDTKNHIAYELNDYRLDRMEFVDGKKLNQAKPKLRVKLDQWIQVTIEVTATAIVTSIKQEGNNFPDIDRFENPKSGLKGKFGFRVPGKDKLAVGGFAFTSK